MISTLLRESPMFAKDKKKKGEREGLSVHFNDDAKGKTHRVQRIKHLLLLDSY